MSDFRFVPAGADSSRRPADFPRVSAGEQAARDAVAEQLVADELATTDTGNPQAQAALEQEFRQRFHKPAPGWKFAPADEGAKAGSGFRFIPLEPEQPAAIRPGEVLRNVLTNNPLTAAAETVANLGSQVIGLPVAGLAGLATAAGHAMGLTDRTGADVVHAVGNALTYMPKGELGQGGAGIVAAPFEKLADVGQKAGSATLDATGSPLAATVVDTAINAAPMAISPAKRAAGRVVEKVKASAAGPEWAPFPAESGSLGIPRAEMPQIQNEHRGALVQFLDGKGIKHAAVEVAAGDLKPTQAEFSPKKVNGWAESGDSARSVLASSDGYILDGHHQWVAALAAGEPVKVIRFDAPIGDLLNAAHEFPSAKRAKGATSAGAGDYRFTPVEATDAQTTNAAPPRAERMAVDDPQMHRSQTEGLAEVRGGGDPGVPGVAGEFRFVPLRDGAGADAAALAGKAGRVEGVQPRELLLDATDAPDAPAPVLSAGAVGGADRHYRGGRAGADGRVLEAAPEDGAVRPITERGSEPGSPGAPGRAADDLAGRDLAAGEMGEARRPAGEAAVATAEGGMAAGDGAGSTTTPRTASARYALIEADDIRASHDVNLRPVEANPFGRQGATRHENELAVQEIVGKFDPERLAAAPDDAHGAPIVAADGVVEAGQRRAIALQRVYQANGQKAIDYRAFLRDNAPAMGLDPAAIDQMRKPILIRLPNEPAPRTARTGGGVRNSAEIQDMAAGVQNSWAPGQNYVPLRDALGDATRAPEVATRAKPIRREDILRPFLKALGINVYTGRVRGKRLGYYMPGKETLRVKKHSDLEVTAHEIGHLLDDRIPAIRAAWRDDKVLRAELKGISYDKASVSEGYAEAVRLWLSNPEALEAAAPRAFGWLETFADTHPYGEALRTAQAGMTSWFEQSALDRARSKIGDPTNLRNRGLVPFLFDKWEATRKGFRQTVVDDLDGIMAAEKGLTGKLSPLGAYETARLSRAAASITDGAVRWGYPVRKADGAFTYSGKGLEEVLRPVAGDLDGFIAYAVGRSSRELLQQGRENLFSPAEVRSLVALETPEFRKAFAELQTWQRGIADFAQELGVLSQETRSLWRRNEYLPFYRVEQSATSGKGAVSGSWDGIKALKGGTGNLREPLQNIVQNANALISAALKNEARQKVAELVETNQGGGRFMQKIPAEARQVKVDAQQVADAVLERMGLGDRAGLSPEAAKYSEHVAKQIAEAPDFYSFMLGGQAPKGKNIVAVMKAGKPEYYEVAEPLLLRALTAIDRPAQSWVIKLLGLPKRIGQASIVLDPSFMAANFARDQIMAGIMTRSGFRPLIDAMDGMRRRVTADPLYREWVANGGGMSSIYLDESRFRAKLEQFYRSQGIDYRTVIDSPKKFLSMVETFGDAFESATRIGSFKRSLAKGEHPRHAAYEAREISVDFSMAGDAPAVRALFDLVMFLRPTVVSWDRLYRGVAHDPNRGAIAAKTAMLGLASAALYLMNRGDPRYDDMPDYLKDSHFHIFLGDKHFMIPRPFEPGAIGRIAEIAVEKVMNEDPEGLGADLARVIGNTFHLNLMPQVAGPLVEQYANKNSFTGAPIETPDHANIEPFLRTKPGTSETMKAAGMLTRDLPENYQLNPVRAEALLRGYLNSWGAYGLLASDRLLFGDKLPEMRADEMPVVRRFYKDEPAKHTKFESQFYEYLAASKRLRGTMRQLDDEGLRTYADEKEKGPLSGEAKPLERAAKNLSGINNDMQAIRRDQALTPAEKRERLDAKTVERNALLKDAVQASKAAQKAKAATPAEVVQRMGIKP